MNEKLREREITRKWLSRVRNYNERLSALKNALDHHKLSNKTLFECAAEFSAVKVNNAVDLIRAEIDYLCLKYDEIVGVISKVACYELRNLLRERYLFGKMNKEITGSKSLPTIERKLAQAVDEVTKILKSEGKFEKIT